jgi:hypothetical protein
MLYIVKDGAGDHVTVPNVRVTANDDLKDRFYEELEYLPNKFPK